MQPLAWYNTFATFYNLSRDYPYSRVRPVAIDQLGLTQGDVVFDVFCGPGINFPLLADRIGVDGRIVGVDGSAHMLQKAKAQAERLALNVAVLQADFSSEEGRDVLTEAITQDTPQKFLFTLGLTCLADWRAFFSEVFAAAPSGARFCIMDAYSQHQTFGARCINWIGSADCSRPVWEELERRATRFEKKVFRPFAFWDVSVVVAAGEKA